MDKCGTEHKFEVFLCERCGETFCSNCCAHDEHSENIYCPACGCEVHRKEAHNLRSFTEKT